MKKYLIPAFLIMAAAQWYLPLSMIRDMDQVLAGGQEIRLVIRPFDPADPFRGNYLQLLFEHDFVEQVYDTTWHAGERVFISLYEGNDGLSRPVRASREKPESDTLFLEGRAVYFIPDAQKLYFSWPFDRYYVNEKAAPRMEEALQNLASGGSLRAWALLNVSDGQAVLRDVVVEGRSLRELADEMR